MFEKLKKAVEKEIKARFSKSYEYFQKMEKEKLMGNWYVCEIFNKREREKLKKGEYTKKQILTILKTREAAKIEKETKKETAKIDRIANAGDYSGGKITVEWKKSKTWGANPHAEYINYGERFTGTASGCGYDKLSAAISEALNKDDKLLKLLYLEKEKHIKKQNREIFGYGSGSYTLPHFEGGVGVSCYPSIFEKIGFQFECVASGESFDAYTITRKPKTRKTRKTTNK